MGATSLVTVFLLVATRSAEGVKRLLGEGFTGILGSDRRKAYNGFDSMRQICWAHLKWDFQALVDRSGESRVIDKLLLNQSTTRKTCANILKLEPALWTFVDHEGIEPTNNAAERPLRRGVIWQKRSFGTQSEQGSLFVERILTAVLTLRQQKRDVLEFLIQVCHAKISGPHSPSLLPTN